MATGNGGLPKSDGEDRLENGADSCFHHTRQVVGVGGREVRPIGIDDEFVHHGGTGGLEADPCGGVHKSAMGSHCGGCLVGRVISPLRISGIRRRAAQGDVCRVATETHSRAPTAGTRQGVHRVVAQSDQRGATRRQGREGAGQARLKICGTHELVRRGEEVARAFRHNDGRGLQLIHGGNRRGAPRGAGRTVTRQCRHGTTGVGQKFQAITGRHDGGLNGGDPHHGVRVTKENDGLLRGGRPPGADIEAAWRTARSGKEGGIAVIGQDAERG